MKPKTMILMVVAITCGLGASYMTAQLLSEREQPEEQEKVPVLVAKKNLDMGVIIKDPQAVFEEKLYTKGDEPKDAVTKLDQLKGRQLKRSRRVGEWVSEEDLFGADGQSIQIPLGHRAVGMRVTPDQIAAGFCATPHSRVDIYSTVRRDERNSYSVLLLEDVLVLAADNSTIRDSEASPKMATVVTLALTPEQVAKFRLAETIGPLSLALRGFGEGKVGHEIRANLYDVTAGAVAKKEEATRPQPEPKPKETKTPADRPLTTHVVAIFEGNKQEFWEYKLDENRNVLGCRVIDAAALGTPIPSAPGAIDRAPKASEPDKISSAPSAGVSIGTTWVGDETLAGYGKLEFRVRPNNGITMIDVKGTLEGSYRVTGNRIEMDFGEGVVYSGTITGQNMGGTAQNGIDNWIWTVRRQ